ncbi:TonB-dependent receptor domain-containing protein [Sphingobium sufflavum]|uniref:TonB-dependent receptor domain-containing protein n=1 Tax=Sphingobium sufflavum TaxID=1129547 RepID=UPI002278AA57|nr:TonB-dependent receptor [Sphingobium sufflavum]
MVDTGYTVPGTTNTAYRAAKGARTDGVDVELAGEILPGWNMTASYSHAITKDAANTRLNSEMPSDTAKFWTTYRFPVGGRDLTLGGGVNWNGGSWITLSRYNVTVDQGAYLVANLMARYDISDSLSATVNVSNLFDKTYYASLQAAALYDTPRSVLGSVRYRF